MATNSLKQSDSFVNGERLDDSRKYEVPGTTHHGLADQIIHEVLNKPRADSRIAIRFESPHKVPLHAGIKRVALQLLPFPELPKKA